MTVMITPTPPPVKKRLRRQVDGDRVDKGSRILKHDPTGTKYDNI